MLKPLLKKALLAIAPETTLALLAARARARSHRLNRQWGLPELNDTLLARFGPTVRAGPFEGLALPPEARPVHLGPFLLGTYESEIHPWLDRIRRLEFGEIVNVGANFGYYAAGLARWFPRVPGVAFDMDGWARHATARTLALNGVSSVEVLRFCSPAWLDRHLGPRSLIVCDCDGCELTLFCSRPIPALETATMIVEMHERIAPGVTAAFRARFAGTHVIETVPSRAPRPPDLDLGFLSEHERALAVTEIREPQAWMLLTPKSR